MPPKRFRIAFSFAGEKRDFVAAVAGILATRFGKDEILYDQFHEAEFARFDLGIRLPTLYGEQSDLIVPVLCPDYDEKRWTGWEWIYIHDLLTKADGHRVMPSRFKRAHVDGLSSAAGYFELDEKTPEEFAALILERLAINEGKPRDHYLALVPTTVSTPRISIPHNLPALQPFFGREQELERIADALAPGSLTWGALIDGLGGMGKTSLAVRAAYDAADAFDAIVFVSLKGRELDDDGIRDLSGFLITGLAELLNELARELGQADIAKAPEEQRPRRLLDALRGTRTLLVLDNLESLLKRDRDVVYTFVTKLPPGCKAILTSRVKIGSGAEGLTLERLSEDAALATLETLAENNQTLARTSAAERRTLYHETGGKPLLLRWTAGQIGRGSCVTLADAIAYLRSCPEGNDPLEFVFGDLAGDFRDEETRVLCALTHFTRPATLAHIVDLAGCSGSDADRASRSLVNRSLVVPSQELKTFVLVPLVADFLRRKKPDVVAETGDRLEQRAYALVVENGYQNHDRFPLLDAAWPLVSAALPRFIAGANDRLQTVCSALDSFFDFTGRWDEQLALSQDAESRAVAAGDLHAAGKRAFDAGWFHYWRQQSRQVLICADRAEAHWRAAGAGAREHASALRLRGMGHDLAKNHRAAIDSLRESLDLLRALNPDSADVASTLNSLANAESAISDFDAAERDYREALRIARLITYDKGVATYIGNLAELSLDRKDWTGAESLAREGLVLAEGLGRLELIASNSERLAQALVRQERKAEALPHARRAVDLYTRLNTSSLATARDTLAECES